MSGHHKRTIQANYHEINEVSLVLGKRGHLLRSRDLTFQRFSNCQFLGLIFRDDVSLGMRYGPGISVKGLCS